MTLVAGAVPDDRYGMNFIRLATVGAAAMFMGGVLPSVASATDYCVYPNQSCGANNTQYLQPTLELAASTGDADRILLGAHKYVAPPNPTAFSYTGNSPVEIVGSGRGQTILTGPEFATNRVLYLAGGPGSSVHDLTIHIPRKAGQDFRGLLTGNTARRIEVTEDPDQGAHRYGAMLLEGGVLEDSSVNLDRAGDTIGVLLGDALVATPNRVRESLVRGATGVRIEGAGAIERSRVFGRSLGVAAAGEDITIDDSLVAINGDFGTVLRAETKAGWDTNVTADGVTLFGPNLLDIGGIAVSTSPDPTRNAHLTLTNSIVRGGATPLAAVAGGQGTATISASYSDYDPTGNIAWGGSISESHVTNLDNAGLFNEAPGQEYSLLPGSPLLDRGDPDAPQGLDLNGNPRVADGNGDGFARRDLGAFELQPAMAGPPPGGGTSSGPAADTKAPVISGFRAARSRLPFAHATCFRWTLSEKARVVVKIQRVPRVRSGPYRTLGALKAAALEGANRLRFGGRVHGHALRPGRYRAVIRATDAAGNRSASQTTTFQVTS